MHRPWVSHALVLMAAITAMQVRGVFIEWDPPELRPGFWLRAPHDDAAAQRDGGTTMQWQASAYAEVGAGDDPAVWEQRVRAACNENLPLKTTYCPDGYGNAG